MALKRSVDIVFVVITLPIILPLISFIALLIRVTSTGPVFFRQQRVGKHEKPFTIYKFRTMVNGAETVGTSITTWDDPRITPLGKILRKLKVDELPQVFNVIKGDLSLVGPRPDVPEIVEGYTPEMRRILNVPPGITSLATLHFRDEEWLLANSPDADRVYAEMIVPLKVKLGMIHVDQPSFASDLKIFFQTLWMLSFGKWWPIEEPTEVTALKNRLRQLSEN